MEERSLIAHASFRESSEKFDHLIFAAIIAVCAYLVQTIPFGKIGLNVETMFLYVLLVFGAAGVFAFKRSEWAVQVHSANHLMLDAMEKRDQARSKIARLKMDKCQRKTYIYYRARNVFFFSGFVCYVLVKVFQQYVI